MNQTMKREHHTGRTRSWALALAAASGLAVAGQMSVATLYVSQTSPTHGPPYATWDAAAHTIQEAVDAASDGDTVLVGPGEYGLTNQVTVTNAILLQSTMGAGETFLDTLTNIWCLWISNSAAIADGFTMQNPSGPDGLQQAGGAFLVGATVQNCNFTNFYAPRLGKSVAMTGGILSNSIVIYNHYADGPNAAVYCSGGGLVTDCQILGLGRYYGSSSVGVYLDHSQLRNSFILGARGGAGESGGQAVFALSSAIVGCTITGNACDGQGSGAYLEDGLMDRCLVLGNTTYGGETGVGGAGVFETNSLIRNSLIVSNYAYLAESEPPNGGLGGGVYMRGGALVNCTVAENRAWSGLDAGPPFPVQIGHGAGVFVESGGLTNFLIYSNYFVGDA